MYPDKLLSDVCHVRYYEKKRPKYFFRWKDCHSFQKLCFQEPLRCYRIDILPSTVTVRTPFQPLKTVFWGLSHSIRREKICQFFFYTGKIAFFFKFFCFQQPLRCNRNDLLTSTVFVKLTCGPLWVESWCFSCSIIREKKAKILSSLKSLPFFQWLVFPSTSCS